MILLFFTFWIVLNGRVTWEILWLGAAISGLAMLFLWKGCDWSWKKEGRLYRCVPLLIAYSGVVIWEIIKANLNLIRVIYRGRPDPVVRVVETRLKTRLARMVLANCITLTPGTITLACRENELTIHCLTPEMAEGLDHTVFERRLEKMEEALHG